ncbi:MAG: hypothetical protein RDV48_31040 [Candidatus Eremiobacteraeota bacterium]|nr:hypothetical protein [Candidatus Eremiobacteraeota bacterium]
MTELEKHRDEGFESAAMLPKGFSFMIGLIPSYLKRCREDLPRAHYGRLAKLYYCCRLTAALSYVDLLDDEYVEENAGSINRRIDGSKLG